MKENLDEIRKYLVSLRAKTGMSWVDISAATGLPDSTIRKVFSGETADPRFETISLIVSAMGGSLDELLSGNVSGGNSDLSVVREIYEKQIKLLNDRYEKYVAVTRREKMILFILSCSLIAFLLIFIVFDFAFGNVGWIRY